MDRSAKDDDDDDQKMNFGYSYHVVAVDIYQHGSSEAVGTNLSCISSEPVAQYTSYNFIYFYA
jgi:hypothetical protein